MDKRKSEISEELTLNNIECMEMEYGKTYYTEYEKEKIFKTLLKLFIKESPKKISVAQIIFATFIISVNIYIINYSLLNFFI